MYRMNDPIYSCPSCDWEGTKDQLADDGPGHEWCCPMCGCDDLIEESDEVK